MDKNNKYYKIIENLIKNHKKFQGCEAILDDIINDVFAHSEVIINSVSNDSVVNSYLEKVVSTSIITVPKKLGFNRFARHTVINTETKNEPEVIIKEEPKIEIKPELKEEIHQKEEIKVNTEYVDKMINLVSFEEPKTEPEIIETDEDIFNTLQKESSAEEIQNTIAEQQTGKIQETEPQYDITEENFNIQESTIKDSALIDFIHDSNEDDKEEAIEVPESSEEFSDLSDESESEVLQTIIEEPVIEETSLIEEDIEPALLDAAETPKTAEERFEPEFLEVAKESVEETTDIIPQTDAEPLETISFADEAQEISLDIDSPQADILEETEINETDEFTSVSAEPLNVEELEEAEVSYNNTESELTDDKQYTLAEDEQISLAEDTDFLQEQPDVSLEEFGTEDNFESFGEGDSLLQETGEDLFLEENVEKAEDDLPEISKTDFSVFDYSPEPEDEDNEEIGKDIMAENNKYPSMKIAEIFNLKYKENLTIDEISEKLGIQKSEVFAALNKIIDLV